MKYCQACGAKINDNAFICPKCGCKTKQGSNEDKPKGSIGWLIFWILVFWPVAIIYYLIRKW